MTSALPAITVTPGAASLGHSSVTVGSATLAAGASTALTLTVRDAAGNRLTTGGSSVTFTKGTGTSDGTIGTVTDNADGTYSATFSATAAGTARAIGATIGGAAVTTASPTITVSPGALSLAQSTLTAGATTLVSGASTTLLVTSRDALGNALRTGGAVVALVKGAGTSDGTISAVTDHADGTYSATFTATTAGSARTVSATVGGAALTSAAPAITVTPGAPSSATSTLGVSRTTLFIGDTATLELTARDAAGNLVGSGGAAVAFTKGAGSSDGTIGTTVDVGDGRYRAILMATSAGTARSIGATIGGVALTTAPVSITVSSVPPSLALSSVTVGASSIASGTATTLTLTVRDAGGNAFTSGGLTVAFTLGAGTSTGAISATTDQGDGTYTATFTGALVGTPRALGATIGGQPLTSAAPTITVTPGAVSLAQSTVTVGSATLSAGDATSVTLTTRDAAGNALATGGLAVAFTKGAGTSDGSLSATSDPGDGTYIATFTATTAGSARTIGATIGGNAITSALPSITVTAGAFSPLQSTVTVGSAQLASGASTTLTLTPRDAVGDLIGTGLSVAFVKGAGSSDGAISTVSDVGDGTYTATFTATTAGSARAILATVGGVPLTSAAPTITVVPGSFSAAVSTVAVGSAVLVSGDSTTLTLTARDAQGNALTSGGATVLFTLGSGTSVGTISATTDNGNGTYTARFTATLAGTARAIGATVGGQAVTTAAPTITVAAGAISLSQSTVTVGVSTLASGDSTTLTLTARDAAGNAITTGGATVLFTKGSGTSDGTISATTDAGNGTYTARFVATTAGSARAIGATIGGNTIVSASPSITLTPGVVSLAQSTLEAGAGTLASGAQTALTLTARDAAGNALTVGGLTVAFTKGSGTSDGTLSAVTDNANGTYTATFTATTAGSARTLGATIGGQAITSALPAITVTAGALSLTQSDVTVADSSLASGDSTTLTLTVRDAAGNRFTTGGLAVVFTMGAGTSDGSISAVTDNLDGTYAASFTATTAGTARTIGATIGGVAVTSTLPTIFVTPGALALATSVVSVSDDTVASGAAVTLTLTARDAAGNALTTGGATVLFTKGAGTSDGTISAVTDNANGTYTASFTGTTAGTPRTIGATVGGQAVTSSAPTVTVIPGALSLAQSSVTVSASSIASGATATLTLTARDAAGNAFTTGGLTVAFTKGAGTSDGTLSAVTDNANGTYTATFTGTTSGTARAIGATIGAQAVTSVAPTITVTPGAISPATSTIAAAPTTILLGQSSTLTLTNRDAAGNLVTTGGATVVFTKVSGFADGPLSATTDVGNGTYTATFTAATGGVPRVIGATINGAAVTTTLPAITVTAPPLMALASDSVLVAAQINTAAAPLVVAVANIGGGSISGLSATRTHVSGPPTCSSVNWLAAPTFDMGGVANPVSLMTLQANATGLELGTCVRRVIVSSTTPSVAPETLMVALNVGRSAAAAGVVNVVMMGDASNNVVQTITPTPILRIDNGGRGTVTNLTATILSQSGLAECVDPFDDATCTPWLAPGDLVWSSPTLPATHTIVSQVRPFSANATIRVAGTGMAPRDFQISVAFNVLPELVTNPRNLVVRGLVGQTITSQPVMAFNQNVAHPGLTNFRQRIPLTAGFWLSLANFNWQTVGDSGRLTIAFPATGAPLFVTDSVEILADCTNPNDCYDFGADSVVPKRFWLRFTLIAEPGIAVPFDSVTVFATDSLPRTVDIPVLSPGASETAGPFSTGISTSVPWITGVQFVGGGASTPATLRLTLDPRLLPAGDTVAVQQIQITKQNAGPGDLPQHGTTFFLTLRRLP